MELAFLPEEAEYTDSTERVLVASVISVTQNQLFLWILPTYPGTAEVTETANSAVSVTSAASYPPLPIFLSYPARRSGTSS